jgi:hypothetical protein
MLSIVIPARNEEENIEPLYSRLAAVLDAIDEECEIIFSIAQRSSSARCVNGIGECEC